MVDKINYEEMIIYSSKSSNPVHTNNTRIFQSCCMSDLTVFLFCYKSIGEITKTRPMCGQMESVYKTSVQSSSPLLYSFPSPSPCSPRGIFIPKVVVVPQKETKCPYLLDAASEDCVIARARVSEASGIDPLV